MRLWYFHDENAIRWNRIEGATAYRLRGKLIAGREHAGDTCAAPPIKEQTVEVDFDKPGIVKGQETTGPLGMLPEEAGWFHLTLPELPPEDAWWVAVDNQLQIDALDANGAVIDSKGSAWVRDLFCSRPRADG